MYYQINIYSESGEKQRAIDKPILLMGYIQRVSEKAVFADPKEIHNISPADNQYTGLRVQQNFIPLNIYWQGKQRNTIYKK